MGSLLIVDSSESTRNRIKEIVSPLTLKIFETDNGLEALRLYKEEKPNLVITEIVI